MSRKDMPDADADPMVMAGEFVQDRPFHLYVRVPEGRKCSFYQVTANRHAAGVARSWTFTRVQPKPEEVYGVALTMEGDVTCECVGYLYHKKCKHAGITIALLRHYGVALGLVANPPKEPCRSCGGKKSFPHPEVEGVRVACPHCVTGEA